METSLAKLMVVERPRRSVETMEFK
jgi:hypothetical protein